MSNGGFVRGNWVNLPSNCTRSFALTYVRCAEYGLEAVTECAYWVTQAESECIQWAWQQVKKCSGWSWIFCVLFAIIVTVVCAVVAIVSILVCAAFTVVELVFCLLWTLVSIIGCLSYANGGTAFLLTDGTVMVQECKTFFGAGTWATTRWWKLTPDPSGSYAQGTWSRLADSHVGRKYFASAVLADGRLVVCGGEYSDASGVMLNDWTNTSEIYDPVANTWKSFAPPAEPGSLQPWAQIGDAPCAVLPYGTFLLGSDNDNSVAELDPSTLTWTSTTMMSRPDYTTSDEDSWVLMPDQTIAAPSCQAPPNTWIYDIAAPGWQAGNPLPNSIVDTEDQEVGPGLLRYDGTAFFLGATQHTAVYNPSAPQASRWSNGPDLPQMTFDGKPAYPGIHDGPASILPNGNILFGAGQKVGSADSSPSLYFEFDGTTFNRTNDPPNYSVSTYRTRLLPLPNGDVMFCREDDSSFYAYHSEAAIPQDSFRPAIQTCPATLAPGATIRVSGLQFNGLSQAAGYGDDCTTATNYPLVRIVNNQSNHVRYCRTFNHTTLDGNGNTVASMGVATGALVITTNVEIPADIETGDSTLYVVANGIPSQPFSVSINPSLL